MGNITETFAQAPWVIACSIDARWANATSIIEITTRSQLKHEFTHTRARGPVRTRLDVPKFDSIDGVPFNPPRDGSMSVIQLQPSWFDVFAPVNCEKHFTMRTWGLSGDRQTILEKIIEKGKPGDMLVIDLEHMIDTCITDNLSHCGTVQKGLPSWFLGAWNSMTGCGAYSKDLTRTMSRQGDPKKSFGEPAILAGHSTSRFVMRAVS